MAAQAVGAESQWYWNIPKQFKQEGDPIRLGFEEVPSGCWVGNRWEASQGGMGENRKAMVTDVQARNGLGHRTMTEIPVESEKI